MRNQRAAHAPSSSPPWLVLALGLTFACGEKAAPPVKTSLTEGAVARVGDDPIRGESVVRIAAAQKVSLEEARARAISDALFAAEARARGFDARTRGEQSAALARLLVASLREEAEARGPATDAELDEVTARRWFELDRPAGAWVAQVHVAVADTAAAGSTTRAETVARRIRETLLGTVAPALRDEVAKDGPTGIDPAQLAGRAAGNRVIEAVEAVPSDGFEVVTQVLPPFAPDGRTVEPGNRSTLKKHVVEAAKSLTTPGDVTEPFTTDEGIQVLVLLGHTRASQFSRDERRAMVHGEIIALRTRAGLTALLTDLAARSPVEVDRQVDGLLGLVQVSSAAPP